AGVGVPALAGGTAPPPKGGTPTPARIRARTRRLGGRGFSLWGRGTRSRIPGDLVGARRTPRGRRRQAVQSHRILSAHPRRRPEVSDSYPHWAPEGVSWSRAPGVALGRGPGMNSPDPALNQGRGDRVQQPAEAPERAAAAQGTALRAGDDTARPS